MALIQTEKTDTDTTFDALEPADGGGVILLDADAQGVAEPASPWAAPQWCAPDPLAAKGRDAADDDEDEDEDEGEFDDFDDDEADDDEDEEEEFDDEEDEFLGEDEDDVDDDAEPDDEEDDDL